METKPTAELRRVRQWAQDKINAGCEPPWAWFQYMKLIEVTDAILQGMAVTTTVSSQQAEEHPGKRLRLVGRNDRQDSAQCRPAEPKVRLPM
jgi:hypothetical protein